MTTERQIAANRANAKRSTGPKTTAGKLKASRNALRHGLSRPLPIDPLTAAKLDAFVDAVIGDVDGRNATAAKQVGEAQLELARVRRTRNRMMENIDPASDKELCRLLAIDRYEAEALRKRRRTSMLIRMDR